MRPRFAEPPEPRVRTVRPQPGPHEAGSHDGSLRPREDGGGGPRRTVGLSLAGTAAVSAGVLFLARPADVPRGATLHPNRIVFGPSRSGAAGRGTPNTAGGGGPAESRARPGEGLRV